MRLRNVFPILTMLLVVLLGGCKKNADPVVTPLVTLTDPLNNATGVALNSKLSVSFNVAMNPTTITSSTFTLAQGSTAVSGAVTYTGTTATFTPASNLEPNKIYTGTITTGAKSTAGAALASNFTVSFTTGAAPDILPPTVISTEPLNNATGVARNQVVAVTFSEAMSAQCEGR